MNVIYKNESTTYTYLYILDAYLYDENKFNYTLVAGSCSV